MAEKKPAWSLFYALKADNDAIMTKDYWMKVTEKAFEGEVGDADDRWTELKDSFKLT